MQAGEPDERDVSIIVAHSWALALSGRVSFETTIAGLRFMEDALHRDYGLSADALMPLTDVLNDLKARI
jgi:hypothetical protein